MATLYKRGRMYWLRYKTKEGKWRDASTGYRADRAWEASAAKRLCKKQTREEELTTTTPGGTDFKDWVQKWMSVTWGHLKTTTPDRYQRHWAMLSKWLAEKGLTKPGHVTRELCQEYVSWRKERGAGRNTAIHELKFLKQVLDEAMERGHIDKNPTANLGIEKEPSEGKNPWTDDQISKVAAALEKQDYFGWMRVSFLLGLYQAARLRQAPVPLDCIDWAGNFIHFPAEIVKGGSTKGQGFSQPIDPRLMEPLKQIAFYRKSNGFNTLCDMPGFESIAWRKFLDSLGPDFANISHHGLRATFITRAAVTGVPEALTRKFVNHSSQLIHQIYQRIGAQDLIGMSARVHYPVLPAPATSERIALPDVDHREPAAQQP